MTRTGGSTLVARLGLVALGGLAALGLAEGVLRVAAAFDSGIRLVATGRATRPTTTYPTLEAFIGSQAAYIAPHRTWYNHWSNALGFHDEEFVEPKPAGRFRVLVVGDSFTFAYVPYPQGVMTLAEAELRARCHGRDLDLLNMGVSGAGTPEYRILVELGVPRFSPDLVLVNVFLGNDPPDLHRHVYDRSPAERALRHSYTWTFLKNLGRTLRGLRDPGLADRVRAAPVGGTAPYGGTPVYPDRALATDDPALVGPVMSEAAYARVLGFDLGRLYRPGDEREIRSAWQPMLRHLDGLRSAATRAGAQVALALLPSVLQVDDALRAATIARVASTSRYRGLSPANVDPRLPNTRLAEYARARGLPVVDLTPVFVAGDGTETREPLYKHRDQHWTPRGNRLAARALSAFLAPLVCPR